MKPVEKDSPLLSVIFDLDGTVYHGDEIIPGAAEFIKELEEKGIVVRFYTNRAHRTPEMIVHKLAGMNLQVCEKQILTSGIVTAEALRKKRVFCIGEEALFRALQEAHVELCDAEPAYVVVGYVENLKGRDLKKAVQLISSGGAEFIATNLDPYILEDGKRVPENGAIAAAVQAATGIEPSVYGKPNPAGIQMVLRELNLRPENVLIVGDTAFTDIRCGLNAGIRTALIQTGITTGERAGESGAELVVRDYKELRSRLFNSKGDVDPYE